MNKEFKTFRTPHEVYFVSFEDWQVAFCEGDRACAAVLNFFGNQHKDYLKNVHNLEQNNKLLKRNDTIDPYLLQSTKKIQEYTLGLFGRNKIIEAVEWLQNKGVISFISDNSSNKYYKLNTLVPQSFIDEVWIEFLKTVPKGENPLVSYLKLYGGNTAKREGLNAGRLKSNGAINGEPRLKSNDPPFEIKHPPRLKSNDPPFEIKHHIIIDNKKVTNLNKETQGANAPPCLFNEDEINHLENQILDAENFEKKKPAPKNKNGMPSLVPEMFAGFDAPSAACKIWGEWEDYKHSEKGQRFKSQATREIAIRNLCNQSRGKSVIAQQIVDQSRANLWAGLFELKKQNHVTPNGFNPKIIDSTKYEKYA